VISARPASLDEVQAFVCAHQKVLPRGGGTKPALSTPPTGVASLDLSLLTGIQEYEPAEFTFTALAGTRLDTVSRILTEHGQCLPFDPPLVARGATLGGTVAAGLSGPGRYQFGGVRDFLLGVRYIDGEGQLIKGGSRVVKNAAGYDLPKLMVGSLGQFGVLVELTFKVLPQPEATLTALQHFSGLDEALQTIYRLAMSPLDPNAVELEVEDALLPAAGEPRGGYRLVVRLTGLESALPARLDQLKALVNQAGAAMELLRGSEENQVWKRIREMEWILSGWALVKVSLTPRRIPDLEAALAGMKSLRRYSAGGQLLWMATPDPIQALHERLSEHGFSGLVVFGPPDLTRLGVRTGAAFEQRVKKALDPSDRFVKV
jgi:glycolate oxidase FAD binding subunit